MSRYYRTSELIDTEDRAIYPKFRIRVVDPASLTFREEEQGSLDVVRQWLVKGIEADEIPPVTAIREHDGELKIMDGHNRTVVAKEVGADVRIVDIARNAYDALVRSGFDDIEISAMMLERAGDYEQVSRLNAQFGGSNVYERAREADVVFAEWLRDPTNN